MTRTADPGAEAIAPLALEALPAPAIGTTPPVADAARPRVRHRWVIGYIGLALVAALPGMAGVAGLDVDRNGMIGERLHWLWAQLRVIEFGHGLRFWLGVSGATMLTLLLAYPLRKAFPGGRLLGSIAGWFHAHIVLGLMGPVLILYHSNFALGAANANVALFAMLAIAASGIVGHFVYARASAEFYGDRQIAQRHLDGIVSALGMLHASPLPLNRLLGDLAALDADLLTPRRGLWPSIAARIGLERRRRQIVQETLWLIDGWAAQNGIAAAAHRQVRAAALTELNAYLRMLRRAASRSVREQLWARWRLFHLPVFLIMLAAITLHVIAVWDWDRMATHLGWAETSTAAASSGTSAGQIRQIKRATVRIEMRVPEQAAEPAPVAAPPAAQTRVVAVAQQPATKPAAAERPAEPAPRPRVATEPSPRPVPRAAPAGETARDRPTAAPVRPQAEIENVYRELQQRTETPVMGLGAPRPRSLAEQLRVLREKFKANEFTHSEAETGFPLFNKHAKADCASCHQKQLAEMRQASPRQCISCHKEDDVHRGRQPQCASCHTPHGWSQIVRRK